MSQVAENRRQGLEEVKEAAEKLTLRRLEDDGLKLHQEKEDLVNKAEKAEVKTSKK